MLVDQALFSSTTLTTPPISSTPAGLPSSNTHGLAIQEATVPGLVDAASHVTNDNVLGGCAMVSALGCRTVGFSRLELF